MPQPRHVCPHATRVPQAPAYAMAFVLLAMAGCASITRPTPPPPALHLLGSQPLAIPAGCEPSRGAVYRTNFVVQANGHVAGAASASGDGCVERALREWVSSFRYVPVSEAVPVVIDWMDVSASRGG